MSGELTGFRLSPQQLRLWKLQEGLGGADAFRVQCSLDIEGPLDVEALKQAFAAAVDRHEILRSTFNRLAAMSIPVQVIADEGSVDFEVRDASELPTADQDALLQEIFQDLLSKPFDLENGSALELCLVKLGPELHVLFIAASAFHLDDTGLHNLMAEVESFYSGSAEGEDEPLQYADIAEWLNEQLEGDEEGGEEFWRKQEFPEPMAPAIPGEQHGAEGFEASCFIHALDAQHLARIEALCQKIEVSTADLLFTIWQALLVRLTGASELVLGVAYDGRDYEDLEGALGPLERILPVGSEGAPDRTLAQTLRHNHRILAEIGGWQSFFSWEKFRPNGDSREALYLPFCFETVETGNGAGAGGLAFRMRRRHACTDRFHVRLSCVPRGEGLDLEFHHDVSRFSARELQWLAARFERLLTSGLEDPETTLDRLDLLGTGERGWLVEERNRTTADYPADSCVHELIARQAQRTPGSIALRAGDQTLTYHELDQRATDLGRALAALGVGPEVVVGVCLERSLEMVVALLAIWKAGGAYLPLDPTHPQQRIAFLLEETAAPLVLTQRLFDEQLGEYRDRAIYLEEGVPQVPAGAEPQIAPAGPDNLAYTIFTSGSTGKAKGVMVCHRGVVNYLHWAIQRYGVTEGLSVPLHSPLGFDLTVTSLFAPLLAGGTVVLLAEEDGPQALGEALPGEDWNLVKLTPAHLELLSQQMSATEGTRVRTLILGGEALRGETLATWMHQFPDTRAINEYGPTETVVGCCVLEVPPGSEPTGAVPIGQPIANTQLYVLDRYLQPVAVGMPGELWVGGVGVARGYLKRPELTADRFLPDPFSGILGARLYRTGDLARYLPEGDLEFLGRVDHQVKIRGFRIEPGEIEAVLGSHPGVREVAVVARKQEDDHYLAAYVVEAEGVPTPVAELRDFLRQRLPEYMVPLAWSVLDALPLTANGKVDRASLPEPDAGAGEASDGVGASTPVEEILAGIWAEALHRERIAADDDFFDLGGHSLLATQVITRIQDALGVEMSLRSLFDNPTLKAFSRQIEAEMRSGKGLDVPPIEVIPRDGNLLASFAQQRLFFLETLMEGTTLYHIPIATRIEGPFDHGVVEQSFTELVRRHESLRTLFTGHADGVMQVIQPAAPVRLPLVDLMALPEPVREAESRKLAQHEARRLFDLTEGPLLRVSVLRLAEEEHVVLISMHHIITDGWSVGVLVRELGALVDAYSRRQPSPLDELPIQYADYAHWQRQWLRDEVLDTQLDYWRGQLRGMEPLNLPTDRPRAAVRGWRGDEAVIRLKPELKDALEALSRQLRSTLFMTLLAAFDSLLHRYTGQRHLAVGTPIANRMSGDLEALIGFFVNTLALPADFSGDPSFEDFLGQIRDVCLGAYAHQDLPFEVLVDDLQPQRDLSRTPIFEVMFALQNAPAGTIDVSERRISMLEAGPGSAKFDWTLSLEPSAIGLTGSLQYASDLFDAATIQRTLDHFEVLLGGLLADPSCRVSELPLLTSAERLQLLESAGPEVTTRGTETLPQLFEAVAERYPESIAVVCDDQRWTYQELHQRAGRLAQVLRGLGVGPEVRVALCAERSYPMVVGILGTLMAGGAYVPLDPAYPRARLDYLLRDSGAPVMLTESHLLANLPPFDGRMVSLIDGEGFAADEAGADGEALHAVGEAAADNAAYVIYTSGSTGQPKGVVVTHANVARLLSATQPWFQFGPTDAWTLFHSYAFDFSVWEIWGALLGGGQLVVVPYLVSRSPEEFHSLLVHSRVTVLNQTPSAFNLLIHSDENSPSRALSLRSVIFGGEALELSSLKPWFGRHGDRSPQLVNMYGITETTVHVTYRPVGLEDLEQPASFIGVPIPDLELHVLDPWLRPAPIGVAGELCVGGHGLARGYLGRPSLTAQRFSPNPWSGGKSGAEGTRLYRSGDLGRRLANGDIEYLGRIDHQVKIRGFRIELGEVEAALRQAPAVREAAVVARPDASGELRLVGYVIPKEDREATTDELQAFLRGRLPEHALPTAFVVLEEFPLTAHGKLDVRALPEPDALRPDLQEAYVPPQTPQEKALATVWAETLGIERVGIHDNFFALGGDSIRSIQILTRAREHGLELSVQQLFQYPTISELLAVMGDHEVSEEIVLRTQPFELVSEADRERLPPDLEDAYPLSKLQAGMLYHMDLMPDSPVYHNVDSFLLMVPFDLEKLQTSVDQVIARHATLRTAFDLATYSEPLQLVHQEASLPVSVEDLRHLSAKEQEGAVEAYIDDQIKDRFDFGLPPQLRIHIQRRSDDTFQFTLTENHAILDGWSLHSTLMEIFEHYQTRLRGEEPAVEPPPALPFREFVALELEMLASEEAREYWEGQLDGFTALELPRWTLATAPRLQEGARILSQETSIPFEVADALRRLASQTAVTMKSVLLAAHLKALSVLSGSPDVMTGVVGHGRPEEAAGEETRGLFLNTLPFRQRFNEGTWVDLIREVFEGEREQLAYRRFPLSELQQKFGDQPLFETAFNYTHFHVVEGFLQTGGVQVLDFKKSEETSMTMVAGFHVNPLTHHIGLELACDSTQISAANARVFASHYLRILAAMAEDPFAHHRNASPLTSAQRHQVLVEWNDTVEDYDRQGTLHVLFERQVARDPEAVAIVAEKGWLSYGELNRRANRLAHRLVALGVGRGELVALSLERQQEMPVALLAVLKAGGAYVPLSNDWPVARSEWILSTLAVRHLVTDAHRLEAAEELREVSSTLEYLVVVEGAGADSLPDAEREANLEPRSGAQDLAYIIFTSGSTGNPKGVAVRHRPVINLIEWITETFHIGPTDRVLFTTSLSFDLSVYDVFGLLAAGGSIRIAASDELADPERLVRLLRDECITFWDSAPAALQQLVPLFSQVSHLEESALRLVFLSGDWIPLPLPDFVRESFPRARVISLGGATEATVWSNFHPIREIEPQWVSIPYGRPIQNARYQVLDASLFPCPLGTPGDLFIGGECLSSGYAAAPLLTAERYLPDPYSERPGGRLYRTGDRACYWPDGKLEFLGRLDHQVKIRGFRIELGEIEAALVQHEEVQTGVVLAREDTPGDKRLVAYWVASGEETPTTDTLREFLLRSLPEYMVPAIFLQLPELPVTANGKLNRAALPAPQAEHLQARAYVAPRTSLERSLAQIWGSVLGLDRVGVHDDFFAAGGHSLLAIQLVSRIREELSADLPLHILFDSPSVAELAVVVAQARSAGTPGRPAALPTLAPAPDDLFEPFPLTDLQQAYWLGQRADFDLGSVSAHIYQEFELGAIDVRRLEQAWQSLIERHPMLRMVVLSDGRQQILERAPEYRIGVLDLSQLPAEEAEKAASGLGREMVGEGPSTDQWPLFDFRLSRLEPARFRAHLSVSLLLCDAVSFHVLTEELIRFYADLGASLPTLELTYRDYVQALRTFEESETFAASRDYWLERLPNLPSAPALPVVTTPGTRQEVRFIRRSWELEAESWSRVKVRAAQAGLTPTAVILGAYAQALAGFSRTAHFTINILFFNRMPLHPQVNEVLGNFSSTILLEVDASGEGSFESKTQRLQQRLWQDMEHSDFSGVQVLRALNRQNGLSSSPVMPVVFTSDINLIPEEEVEEGPEGTEDEGPVFLGGALQTPQVWLDHQVSERDGKLLLNWDVLEHIFPPGMIDQMFVAYRDLVARLAEEDLWQSAAPLRPSAEMQALVAEYNATEAPTPQGLLHEGFAAQARLRPQDPAVITAERTLSYGELYSRSNQVGRRVRELGALPNQLVAVVMDKGWEQIVAVLGILNSGAAYLPIDPEVPGERLRYLLKSGGVEIALTTEGYGKTLEWSPEVEILVVDSEDALALSDEPLEPVQGREDLAYVIFTSGSTGLPKGVSIEHHAALNTVVDVNQRFNVGPEDRALALSALNFDLSVYDVFGLLAVGGALVVPSEEGLRKPSHWVELMSEHRVTLWNSVPALMEILVDFLEEGTVPVPAALRLVMLSGDWIPVTLPDRLRSLAPEVATISLGGATEASIWSILYPIEEVEPHWASIPYGRPMVNQRFYVLDDQLEPRPVWVPGELYIGGVGVARGYWGDEERTNASFIEHHRTGERLYRTGDFGRWLPDRQIEFLGREDLQVKVQGYRIELGEIEAALLEHPEVRVGVAAALGERRGGKRLAAFFVANTGASVEVEELRAFLVDRLPQYMIPATFVELETLPLTANGKVDRRALLDAGSVDANTQTEWVAPRDEVELQLVEIWQELLETSPVGVRDSFFDLGGHSLVAVRLMSRVRSEFGPELPISALFEAPTIEALAPLLRQHGETPQRSILVPIRVEGEGRPFFCIHPVGGNVMCYRELAGLLGSNRPFYGLQTPDGEEPLKLEEWAARYLEALRTVQSEGPYLLGGWSMGGVLAFEVAQQLQALGEEVELVAMIDSSTPGTGEQKVEEAVLTSWFARDLGGLVGVNLEIEPAKLRELDSEAQLELLLQRAQAANVLPPDLGISSLRDPLRMFRANYRALLDYVPRPYAGRLALFAAQGEEATAAAEAWSQLAAEGAEVHVLAGDHYSILRPPHVEDLAGKLDSHLPE